MEHRGGQTAARAFALLRLVVNSAHPVSLAELGSATGFDKNVVYRLIRTLEAEGFVIRDPTTRRIEAGGELISLAAIVMDRLELRDVAAAGLQRLRTLTSETTTLHIRHGLRRVCVKSLESPHSLRRVVPLGETAPLYIGLSGKVIAAHLAQHERDELLAEAATAGEDVERIQRDVAAAQLEGYLAIVNDRTPDVGAMSAPIFGPRGPVASITVSGPAHRWSLTEMSSFTGHLLNECVALSATLGHREGTVRDHG